MIKKEFAFLVLAATLLTAGTARAADFAVDCMDDCRGHFGTYVLGSEYPDELGGGGVWKLSSCTQSANESGSSTTCYYSEM
jgi:hypothetical protein